MLLGWKVVSDENRCCRPECHRRNDLRRGNRRRFLEDDGNGAAHCSDAVERQPLAGLLCRLRLLLLHHLHAVSAHLGNRRRRRDRTRARRIGGLLAEKANYSSEKEQKLKCAFHVSSLLVEGSGTDNSVLIAIMSADSITITPRAAA